MTRAPRTQRALVALLLGLLSACSNGCSLGRKLWSPAPLPEKAEHLTVRTNDGWDLSLIHYAPREPGDAGPAREGEAPKRPVLLVHGIITNERNLDYDERHSLARSLAARGFDVWALSLRGTGESAHASLLGGEHKYDWDFDSFCTEDIPAAIGYIQRKSGSAHIDYIGHSMGGMLYYCLLARGGAAAEAIGAGVTLGSPVGFRWGSRFTQIARAAALAASRLPVIKLDGPTLLALPVVSWFPEPLALLLYNPANMNPDIWSGFLAIGVDDESPLLAADFLRWLDSDRFTSRDGALDYERLLSSARTPTLVIAGKADQLGFPPLVRRGYEALGGEKEFRLAAIENGARGDYGHMDLLLGESSERDIFEPTARYLAAHQFTH